MMIKVTTQGIAPVYFLNKILIHKIVPVIPMFANVANNPITQYAVPNPNPKTGRLNPALKVKIPPTNLDVSDEKSLPTEKVPLKPFFICIIDSAILLKTTNGEDLRKTTIGW